MKFLSKLKSGNFWISFISAGVLIAQSVFDFEIKTEYLNQILLGLMGLLTMFGIVSDHGNNNNEIKVNSKNNDNANSNIKSICDTISLLLNKASIKVGEDTTEQLDHLLNILTPKNNEEKEVLSESNTESKQDLATDLKINNEETTNNVEERSNQAIMEEVKKEESEQIAIDFDKKVEEKALQIEETTEAELAEPQKEEVISIVN